jgi:hypothetical protein
MKTTVVALPLLAGLFLAACSGKPDAAVAPAGPPFKPVASILDIMAGQVDPAADFMWESVATISGPKGPIEKAPKTDKEWAEVRRQSLLLIEGANLLMMDGRVVGHPGQKLEDPPGPGDFTPEQSDAAIKADRARFNAFALALATTGEKALKAIEARNVEAFLDAGGDIDEACESCHKVFWYPKGGTPEPGK